MHILKPLSSVKIFAINVFFDHGDVSIYFLSTMIINDEFYLDLANLLRLRNCSISCYLLFWVFVSFLQF